MPKYANLGRPLEESKVNLVERINSLYREGKSEEKVSLNGITYSIKLGNLEECEKASYPAGEYY